MDILHPRFLPPTLSRPAMRAEPWLDETMHAVNPLISFGCDYCATARRTRDVAGRHETDMTDEAPSPIVGCNNLTEICELVHNGSACFRLGLLC